MDEANFSLNERCIKKIAPQFALVMSVLTMAEFFMLAEVSDLINAAAAHPSMAEAIRDIFQVYALGGLIIFVSLALVIGYLFFTRARAEENLREAMKKLEAGSGKNFVEREAKPPFLLTVPPENFEPSFVAPDAEILVVDDDATSLLIIQRMLAATQIKIDTAPDGLACLEKLTRKRYDLIFLDQLMPTLDGVQTLELARSLEENLSEGVPVVALTAVSGIQEMLIARGFTDYMSKPVDPVLMEKILLTYLPLKKVRLFKESVS